MRRRPCLIFSFIIFIIIFFYLLLPAEARAFQVLFQDDFNDDDAAGWLEYSPWGYWKVENGEYQGSTVLQGSPESPSYSVAGDRSWTNYAVSARVKGEEGVDKVILFRVNESNNAYLLDLRSQFFSGGKDLVLVQRLGLGTSGTRIIKGAPYVNYSGQWYELKAVVENTEAGVVIKAYVDGNLVLEYLDTVNPLLTGAVGFEVWPGGYSLPTLGLRTTTSYDIITVTSLAPEPDPVILLPGLGASWNKEALICNEEVSWEEWEMTPGIHHYDGIIQTFQEALGEDFHVFNYDWTKPATQSAEALKTFLDSNITSHPDTKVDLVGHSLGGLVARAYLQEYPDNHGVDQVITLGSPHKGAPQAYYAWEGANFSELLKPELSLAATLLAFKYRGLRETLVNVVQREVPSLRDLLPIFGYLKNHRTGAEIPLGDVNHQNDWLLGNPVPSGLLTYIHTFLGNSGNTPRWLRVLPRSKVDELRGRWEDGRPINKEYAMGDGTVSTESATISEAPKTEFSGINHSGLVTSVEAQEALLGELGILDVSPTPGSDNVENGVFMAALLPLTCPADSSSTLSIRLTDPLGRTVGQGVPVNIPEAIYHPQDQMVIVPRAISGDYQVGVFGEPEEEYRLIIGGIGEIGDVWSDNRGKVGKKGVSIHQLRFTQEPEEFNLNLVQLAKSRLEELDVWLTTSDKPYKPAQAQIREVIKYLEQAEQQLNQGSGANLSQRLWAAFNRLDNLQDNTTNWQKSGKISAETADKILFETTQVRDYLLKALELLGE